MAIFRADSTGNADRANLLTVSSLDMEKYFSLFLWALTLLVSGQAKKSIVKPDNGITSDLQVSPSDVFRLSDFIQIKDEVITSAAKYQNYSIKIINQAP